MTDTGPDTDGPDTDGPAIEVPEGADGAGPERSMSFSDGIFAFAITLLILPLTNADIRQGQVATDLRALAPQFFTFALSFVVIGRYWIGHHEDLRHVARVDNALLWLNLLFLFFIVFLPFPTSVLGDHADPAGVVLYAATIVATALSSLVLWLVAGGRGLLHRHRPVGATTGRVLGTLAIVVAFGASIPIALFVDPQAAQWSWLSAIPLSVLADRVPHRRA